MTIESLAVDASDEELNLGNGLVVIYPLGTLPSVDTSAYDQLACWPVEANDSGTPRRFIMGLGGPGACVKLCPQGPPPPPLSQAEFGGDGKPKLGTTHPLAISKTATYAAGLATFPSSNGSAAPGPILVIAGLHTSVDALQPAIQAWTGTASASFHVQVYNVVDPNAYLPFAPSWTHPLHQTVIAIPVDGGTP